MALSKPWTSSALTPAVICVLLFLVLLGLQTLLRVCLSPLRSLPGPFFARFSRLWYLRQIWRGDFHKTNNELHKRYGEIFRNAISPHKLVGYTHVNIGPIVRIAPNEYSIDDPEALKTIYGHGTSFIKVGGYIVITLKSSRWLMRSCFLVTMVHCWYASGQ